MRRRERTVFDGIEPDDKLSPRVVNVSPALIDAWEKQVASIDDEIAQLHKARTAHVRGIAAARRKLTDK